MIKINIGNIKNWNYIKNCHLTYFTDKIRKRIEKKEIEKYDFRIKLYIKVLLNKRNIQSLAIGDMESLKKYIRMCNNKKILLNKIDKSTGSNLKSELDECLKKIFYYDGFRDNKNNINVHGKKIEWNRHMFISLMNIRTCPYCNRQYITNYEDGKTSADLDHFFLQSEYPFLALSLYNFIPSCQICNSRFKGKTFDAENHIYPYNEEFGDQCKFTIDSRNINYLLYNSDNFDIYLKNIASDTKYKKKINHSIETFKLNNVYKSHKDYILEIIKKAHIYNDEYINYIYDEFQGMFTDKNEIWQCVMGNYMTDDNLINRPLSKLTRDILEEYGIKI